MSTPNDRNREEDALDALIVAAFRQEDTDCGSSEDLPAKGSPMGEEDSRALEALGPDLAQRVISGSWRPMAEEARGVQSSNELRELASAMNRGDENGQLSEKARDEMERRIRELEERGDTDEHQA